MAEGVLNEYDWSVDDMGRESIRVDPEALCPRLCRTVHKSQGLEYDEVVFVQTSSTPIWTLSKNLNYTAYSRAKRKLYLVGSLQMFNGRSARLEARRQNTYIAEWLSSGRVEEPTVREIEAKERSRHAWCLKSKKRRSQQRWGGANECDCRLSCRFTS